MYNILRNTFFYSLYILFRLTMLIFVPLMSIGALVEGLKFNEDFGSLFRYWSNQTADIYCTLRDIAKEELMEVLK